MCCGEDEENGAEALVIAVFLGEPFRDIGGQGDPAWGFGKAVIGLGHEVKRKDADDDPEDLPGDVSDGKGVASCVWQIWGQWRSRSVAVGTLNDVEFCEEHAGEEQNHIPSIAAVCEPRDNSEEDEAKGGSETCETNERKEEHKRAAEFDRNRP